MYWSILISMLFLLLNGHVHSQIRLAPEVGMNYRKYELLEIDNSLTQSNPEFYLGIRGEARLHRSVSVQMQLTYIFRKNNFVRPQLSFNPDYKGVLYLNNELNVNLLLLVPLTDDLKIGGGLGIYHKLNSKMQATYFNKIVEENLHIRILPLWNVLFQYRFRRIGIHVNGFFTPKTESLDSNHLRGINYHRYGFTLGVSYELLRKG